MPNNPYYIIIFHAALLLGCIIVNINPLQSQKSIENQIKITKPKILVTLNINAVHSKTKKLLKYDFINKILLCSINKIIPWYKSIILQTLKRNNLAKIISDKNNLFFEDLIHNDGDFDRADIDPEKDIAVLQFTGGTTGIPKAASLTHSNITANTIQISSWNVDYETQEEMVLAILPFFHVFGMTIAMLSPLRNGACIVIFPEFHVKTCLRIIQNKAITYLPGVPSIFNALNNFKNIKKYDLSSLKLCMSGGAALPVNVKESLENKLNCQIVEGYGLSETSPVATCNPIVGQNKSGSVGIPMQETEIQIRSIQDGITLVECRKLGEVFIRGPQVMIGYWKENKQTKEFLSNGYFKTGDIGYLDEDGYLFLVDRIKDIIISKGYNIYPGIIESSIYQHPFVSEVTVIGIKDEYRGETPKAFISLKPEKEISEKELKEFLNDKLSSIEMPSFFEFRDNLPKTLIGKLSKEALRKN